MILQTLLFVLLRYKMSVWELLNMKSCCEYRKKGLFLTSSLRTPKLFIKEFGDFLMSCHQHCLGVNLLVQR